jgi:hypothetical protein
MNKKWFFLMNKRIFLDFLVHEQSFPDQQVGSLSLLYFNVKSLLKGGVVGYSVTCYIDSQPVIGFDMGGTSTDVSRFDGSLEHVLESSIASVTIQAPQLDINTVAAGGGSILSFRSGLFRVGPESAGAQPGPACYKKGFFKDIELFI